MCNENKNKRFFPYGNKFVVYLIQIYTATNTIIQFLKPHPATRSFFFNLKPERILTFMTNQNNKFSQVIFELNRI